METVRSALEAYGLWLALGLGGLLLLWHLRLTHRLNRLERSARLARRSEEAAGYSAEQLAELRARLLRLEERAQQIERTLERSLQGVGLVRYNPFHDTGGDQSFSLALLDRQANGVVLSSLFTRNACRLFAKPLRQGQSPYHLTAEEEEAIRLARGQTSGSDGQPAARRRP